MVQLCVGHWTKLHRAEDFVYPQATKRFHQIESASTRATLKCQSLCSWDTHRQWDSYLSVPILLGADLLIALWKPAWDISPGYLATGGKKDTGLALTVRLLEGQNQRSLLHEWSRTERCPATHMNSNLYLRLRSWKFNDIAFICGQSMSESVLSRASSSVLTADATRVYTKYNGKLPKSQNCKPWQQINCMSIFV